MNQPTNFILIITDTQATNVIGTYGHPDLRTPNIDRLANSGMKFNRAYTTCPLCTPARAGLFSGIYAHTAGAWTNNLALGTNIHSMGERFTDLGYHAAYIGKWHLSGHDYFDTGICPPGWDSDFWYDGERYLQDLTEDQIRLWRQGLNSYEALVEHQITAEFTWGHRIADRAIQFLTRHQHQAGKPFLLVTSFDEPHHPFTCPPKFVEPFLEYDYPVGPAAFDSLKGKPSHHQEWAASAGNRVSSGGTIRAPMYFGCNSFVDHEIGRIIDAAHQFTPENTCIIFTSDHGDPLLAHGLDNKGPAMYDDTTRIPLLIEWNGQIAPGSESNTLVSHIDLLPTMLEIANAARPPILEGETILPVLRGEENPGKGAVIEFNRYEIEHDSWGGFIPIRALIHRQYKLVINLLQTDELYDLERDPEELRNLIDDPAYTAVRDELHDRLLDWMNAKRDPFRGIVWERRPWRADCRLEWRGPLL
ncbi:MAG: sulfatase-like hydrolase/transferase [Anaerolineaceae bacterium]|nr:sulfatase-like hydrolase/transferase [Anaerolineaceae bacterium]